MGNDENELNVLSTISQLIDEGFSCNDTQTALRISIHDENESDGDSAFNEDMNAFDPRSMFASEPSPHPTMDKSHLATTLLSAINENMDEKSEAIINMQCNDILKDLNYAKISSSIHEMLPIKAKQTKVSNENIVQNQELEMRPIYSKYSLMDFDDNNNAT